MRRVFRAARPGLVLAALASASCGEAGGGPQAVEFALSAGAPPGVEADLKAVHFPKASFADVTRTHPEDSFSGAVVQGKSFQGPSEVYVLTVTLRNGSGRAVAAPDLVVCPREESEVAFRTKKRTVAPGESATLAYFWDPGRVVGSGSARLVWPP